MKMSGILVVAGIARSGLSVTMQMLHSGGYPCMGKPPAFEPFSFREIPWKDCNGYAVKLVDAQLQLPPDGEIHVIRLRRNMKEQAKSINKFNNVFGLPSCSVSRLVKSIRRDYKVIDAWAEKHRVLMLDFEKIITGPNEAATIICDWVGVSLDIERMAACVIDRKPECYPTLLELTMIK